MNKLIMGPGSQLNTYANILRRICKSRGQRQRQGLKESGSGLGGVARNAWNHMGLSLLSVPHEWPLLRVFNQIMHT